MYVNSEAKVYSSSFQSMPLRPFISVEEKVFDGTNYTHQMKSWQEKILFPFHSVSWGLMQRSTPPGTNFHILCSSQKVNFFYKCDSVYKLHNAHTYILSFQKWLGRFTDREQIRNKLKRKKIIFNFNNFCYTIQRNITRPEYYCKIKSKSWRNFLHISLMCGAVLQTPTANDGHLIIGCTTLLFSSTRDWSYLFDGGKISILANCLPSRVYQLLSDVIKLTLYL